MARAPPGFNPSRVPSSRQPPNTRPNVIRLARFLGFLVSRFPASQLPDVPSPRLGEPHGQRRPPARHTNPSSPARGTEARSLDSLYVRQALEDQRKKLVGKGRDAVTFSGGAMAQAASEAVSRPSNAGRG